MLGSGGQLHIVCSNNDALGDQEFGYYISNHKTFWPITGGSGWIGIKVIPKEGEDGGAPAALGGQGRNNGNSRVKRPTEYCFVGDLDGMYHLLKNEDDDLTRAITVLTERAVREYNKKNAQSCSGERAPTEKRACVDARSPAVQGGLTNKVFEVLIASTWHFNFRAMKTAEPVRLKQGQLHTRIQLKHMSKDFNSETLMKPGGLYIRASDFLGFLRSPQLSKFLRQVEQDPRIKLDSQFLEEWSNRMASQPVREAIANDLGADESDDEEDGGAAAAGSGSKRAKKKKRAGVEDGDE